MSACPVKDPGRRFSPFSYRLGAGSYAINCPAAQARPTLFTVTAADG